MNASPTVTRKLSLSFGEFSCAASHYTLKKIHQILDETPIVNEVQIAHWQWIASYYMCHRHVYRGAMPSALLLESETVISQKMFFVDESTLSDEFLIFQALQQSSLKVQDIMQF
jgi:primosomal protein N' (replication factor Y)